MSKKKSAWRVWAKALGEKSGKDDREADTIAWIRTAIMFQLVLTNMFIISGNVLNFYKHFNNVNSNCSQGHTTQVGSNVSGTTSSKEI